MRVSQWLPRKTDNLGVKDFQEWPLMIERVIYEASVVTLVWTIDTDAFVIDSKTVLYKDIDGSALVSDNHLQKSRGE